MSTARMPKENSKISGGITSLNAEKVKKINSILDKIRKKVRPDMSIMSFIDKKVERINSVIAKNSTHAECVKGGSIAKETFLKNDHDVDLFIRFNSEYRGKDISGVAEKILLDAGFKTSRIHGSRDYFQFNEKIKINKTNKVNKINKTNKVNKINGDIVIDYEVIPVLKIHSSNYANAENVTDLSPEHVTWVKSYTDKNPELIDDVRLVKQFCKANNIYGAESYINGFSGHILDILVIHYGSFLNLIKKFASMEIDDKPIVIDHEKNLQDPLAQLNKSKISPLIIIDPIQKDRNAAAALNKEKLKLFVESCKKFIENPDENLFEIKKFDLKENIAFALKNLKSKTQTESKSRIKSKILILNVKTLDGSKDVVGTKVLKAYEDILKHLSLEGFSVLHSGWNFDFDSRSAVIYVIFPDDKLSEYLEREGPPLSSLNDSEKFRNAHSNEKTFIKNGRIYAVIKRKYLNPEDFLKNFLKRDFIMSRVRKISLEKYD